MFADSRSEISNSGLDAPIVLSIAPFASRSTGICPGQRGFAQGVYQGKSQGYPRGTLMTRGEPGAAPGQTPGETLGASLPGLPWANRICPGVRPGGSIFGFPLVLPWCTPWGIQGFRILGILHILHILHILVVYGISLCATSISYRNTKRIQ